MHLGKQGMYVLHLSTCSLLVLCFCLLLLFLSALFTRSVKLVILLLQIITRLACLSFKMRVCVTQVTEKGHISGIQINVGISLKHDPMCSSNGKKWKPRCHSDRWPRVLCKLFSTKIDATKVHPFFMIFFCLLRLWTITHSPKRVNWSITLIWGSAVFKSFPCNTYEVWHITVVCCCFIITALCLGIKPVCAFFVYVSHQAFADAEAMGSSVPQLLEDQMGEPGRSSPVSNPASANTTTNTESVSHNTDLQVCLSLSLFC